MEHNSRIDSLRIINCGEEINAQVRQTVYKLTSREKEERGKEGRNRDGRREERERERERERETH